MITPASFDDIQAHVKAAKREGLCFSTSTQYFVYREDGEIRAFTGIVFHKNKAIFKNSYVVPAYRGKGYFKELFYHRMDLALKAGVVKVEATCTFMSLRHYLANGFKVVKNYQSYTKVSNENI